jgi:TctA family transporter
MIEEHLRRALLLSSGDPMIFVTRPLSGAMIIAALVLLALVLMPAIRQKREEAFQE